MQLGKVAMSLGIEILGLLLLGLVYIDIVITTLTLGGSGPLTGRVSAWVWSVALYIHHRKPNHSLLQLMGWLILLTTPLIWFSLTWIAWTLIFSPFEQAVVHSPSQVPATILQRIYFVGYTLSTLGLGDYQPQGTVWQLATAIASVNGFFIVSLSITYLLPVISAAVKKRQLAIYISTLGGTPDDLLVRCWNGKNFGNFDQHLISLAQEISGLGESYLAYPILHYFHSIERSRDFVLSFVALDEALMVIQYGVKHAQLDPAALGPVRRANAAFLKTLKSAYIKPSSEVPPLPPLELLQQAGIATVSDREFSQATEPLKFRRQLLSAMLHEAGWTWEAIASTKTTNRTSHLDDEKMVQFDG